MNNAALTIRTGDSSDEYTMGGHLWDYTQYLYANIPDSVQSLFPMYGTKDSGQTNTDAPKTLVLPRIMRAFMFHDTGWWDVPMDGWGYINTAYTAAGTFELYQRLWNAGTYDLDITTAYYLFSDVIDGKYISTKICSLCAK